MKNMNIPLLKNILLTLAVFLLFQSCDTNNNSEGTVNSETEVEDEDPNFEVLVEGMTFISQDTILSGWNTFEFINNSEEVHFILLDKYPEGKTIEDGKREVIPVFQEGMDRIYEGKMDESMAAFGKLPEWSSKIIYMGGVGLTSPGVTAHSTINLEPGYYVMECYIKMPNGQFHASMGMAKELIVKDSTSSIAEPLANVKVSISSAEGIAYTDSIPEGEVTFAVKFNDQKPHEHFLGHDVNLVRVDGNGNIDSLQAWMNWTLPLGLKTPAPEGFTFLGGVNEMPEGNISYFTATLEPGEYILISEVPNPAQKNMLKKFTIGREM